MRVAWLSLSTLSVLAAAFAGCVTPVEMTSLLEAPLPAEGSPFLILATVCAQEPVHLLILYPDGQLFHADLGAAGQAARLPPEGTAPSSDAEKIVRDAVALGAVDAAAFADSQGRFHVSHLESEVLSASDLSDLRRRVTLAGFPALAPTYGDVSCADHYVAWADGQHRAVTAAPGEGPWALRHVGEGIRELHG